MAASLSSNNSSVKCKYIYDLPYMPRRDLCRILDGNDQWKELGGVHMNYSVMLLNDFGRSSSPTNRMLEDWGQRNHTISELFVLLSRMHHYQALEILKPYVDAKFHPICDKGELNMDKLIQLHIGQTHISTAIKKPGEPNQTCRKHSGESNQATKNVDSCNFNSSQPERNLPSKLGAFSLNEPQSDSNGKLTNDHRTISNTNNSQAMWVEMPGNLPNDYQQESPVNNHIPRRDLESSGLSEISSASAIPNIPQIDEQELAAATQQWSPSAILGRGGFGTVYKGIWKNTQVAIKRMENKGVAGAGVVPLQQSMGELRILNAIRHDNILPLYGYSLGGSCPCLVYQFMPCGSLEDRLLCRQGTCPLTWQQRFDIARGTARGLQFLHTIRGTPLIHGDIKSANILLDKNLEPKIGDFGLAREGPQTQYTHVKVSRVHGTRPYLPDEYLRGKRISTKVDTYSFGIVLFELGTGLRAYDDSRKYPYLREHVENCENLSLLKDFKAGHELEAVYYSIVELGRKCAYSSARDRPEMVKVLEILDNWNRDAQTYAECAPQQEAVLVPIENIWTSCPKFPPSPNIAHIPVPKLVHPPVIVAPVAATATNSYNSFNFNPNMGPAIDDLLGSAPPSEIPDISGLLRDDTSVDLGRTNSNYSEENSRESIHFSHSDDSSHHRFGGTTKTKKVPFLEN